MTSDIQIPVLPISDPSMFPRAEQQVLGARNLFPLPVKTTSSGNLTITASSDGSITLNTSAATVGNQGFTLSTFDLPTGQSYRASIDNALNKGDNAVLIFQGYNGSSWVDLGVIKDTNTSVTFSSGTYTSFKLALVVSASQTFSNLKFSPMITLATDPDPSYSQYAMTNRQLSELQDRTISSTHTLTQYTKVKKRGNTITASVELTTTSAVSAYGQIATLPDLPLQVLYVSGINESSSPRVCTPFTVDTNGKVYTVLALSSGTTIAFTVTYTI